MFIWCLISNNHLVSHIELWKMCNLTIYLIVEVLDNILYQSIDEFYEDICITLDKWIYEIFANNKFHLYTSKCYFELKFLTYDKIINVSYFGWEYAVAVIKKNVFEDEHFIEPNMERRIEAASAGAKLHDVME